MITLRILVNPFLLQVLFLRNNLFISPLSLIVFLEVLDKKIENYCIMKMKDQVLKDKSLVKLDQRQWSLVINQELEDQEQITILNLRVISALLNETKESITLTGVSLMPLEKPIDTITIDLMPSELWPRSKSLSSKINTTIKLEKEKP